MDIKGGISSLFIAETNCVHVHALGTVIKSFYISFYKRSGGSICFVPTESVKNDIKQEEGNINTGHK